MRDHFNKDSLSLIDDVAYMIFLNRTCFNGLYRENAKGEFNVSFGRYLEPKILDEDLIRADSEILQKVEILLGDFSQTVSYITDYTFIYFDPPYKPISPTACFTSYHKTNFNDKEQFRLKKFYAQMSESGCKVLLSNSDSKIEEANGKTNIDELYKDFIIQRVFAKRSISCSASKRGPIPELLIRNYKDCQGKL